MYINFNSFLDINFLIFLMSILISFDAFLFKFNEKELKIYINKKHILNYLIYVFLKWSIISAIIIFIYLTSVYYIDIHEYLFQTKIVIMTLFFLIFLISFDLVLNYIDYSYNLYTKKYYHIYI